MVVVVVVASWNENLSFLTYFGGRGEFEVVFTVVEDSAFLRSRILCPELLDAREFAPIGVVPPFFDPYLAFGGLRKSPPAVETFLSSGISQLGSIVSATL